MLGLKLWNVCELTVWNRSECSVVLASTLCRVSCRHMQAIHNEGHNSISLKCTMMVQLHNYIQQCMRQLSLMKGSYLQFHSNTMSDK